MLNSDGYKILLTLLNKDEFEDSKKNHLIIKVIQIIGVLLAIRSVLLWF
ncbi:peptidase [Paenibacillus amylolyticus]|uniref:Peptidase n=1 Tax=Paenibacillus amylolyticus TaxID=1451 RepID=A0A5M9X204_PAEAM|nr:peptidase [Paenibacillus amylolyticus]